METGPVDRPELAKVLHALRTTTWWGNLVRGHGAKHEFKTFGERILRRLAKDLALAKGTYTIRFNAAGPAVSGEATLHAERVYVCVGAGRDLGVLYRPCEGRSDIVGGANRWYRYEDLTDWEGFVAAVRQAAAHGGPRPKATGAKEGASDGSHA